jgi:hypothetical protein
METQMIRTDKPRLILRLSIVWLFGLMIAACLPIRAAENDSQTIPIATHAIRNGRPAQGAELLRQVISRNENHAGNRLLKEEPTHLGEDDLHHGERQFEKLSKDLPQLLAYSKSTSFEAMKRWAVRQFAGEGTGSRIDWDASKPILSRYGVHAESVIRSKGVNARIRISPATVDSNGNASNVGFEELWLRLVFELLNLRHSDSVRQLDMRAHQDRITRADYAQAIFFLEHETVQLTHGFYSRYFLEWAEAAGFKSDPVIWYIEEHGWWTRADKFINRFPFTSAYPWGVYGDRFDEVRFGASDGGCE